MQSGEVAGVKSLNFERNLKKESWMVLIWCVGAGEGEGGVSYSY